MSGLTKTKQYPFQTIAFDIKWRILCGDLKPKERLPSIRINAERYGVNVLTMQRSYQMLKNEKYIVNERTKHYQVSADIEFLKQQEVKSLTEQFIRYMQEIGYCKDEIISELKKYVDKTEVQCYDNKVC